MARLFNNSTANYLSYGSPVVASGGTVYTIAGWCKHASAQQSAIYGQGEPGGNHYFSIGLRSTHDAYFESKAAGVTATMAVSSATTTAGAWAHVAGVQASATSRTVY